MHFENDAYSTFSSAFTILLNEHAPLETKIPIYHNKTITTKEIAREIMKRSKLKSLFSENQSQENWWKHKI